MKGCNTIYLQKRKTIFLRTDQNLGYTDTLKYRIFTKRPLLKTWNIFTCVDRDYLLIIPQFCLPLLMEKLSSDNVDAEIDSLLTLVSYFVL